MKSKVPKCTRDIEEKARLMDVASVFMSKYFIGRGFYEEDEDSRGEAIQTLVSGIRKYCTKWQIRRGTIVINSDASIKPGHNLAGLAVISRDERGFPKVAELSWKEKQENNILAMEAWGVLRDTKIWLAEEYEYVSIRTDAKYVHELIQDEKIFAEKRKIEVDADTLAFIFQSRGLLLKKICDFRSICRQANMAADFLAKYARILKEKGWIDPGNYEHVPNVHICADSIYMKNCIPLGLKDILADDIGLFQIIAKRNDEVSLMSNVKLLKIVHILAEDADKSILQNWIEALAELIPEKKLKCFYFEIWNDKKLVEQLEVQVMYKKIWLAYSDTRFVEDVLYNFDIFNNSLRPLAYRNQKLKSRLVLKVRDNDDKEVKKHLLKPEPKVKVATQLQDNDGKEIKKFLLELERKARVELPATKMELGSFDFEVVSFHPKITTKYGDIGGYDKWRMLQKGYEQELNSIPELDFGMNLHDNLVYPVEGILENER